MCLRYMFYLTSTEDLEEETWAEEVSSRSNGEVTEDSKFQVLVTSIIV